MTSSAEQFLQLKNEIAGLRSRVTGLSASGQLYAATGQRIVYGCKVTQGSSATDMTIALESSASGDTAHLNPDLSLTPTYQFEYPNIAGLKSGGFYSLDMTAEVDAVPATGLGRYDIAYIYVGPTGPGFAVATGTPGAGVKTAFDADGLDTSAYDPDTDAAIPVGAFAVARIYVEDDASGIANARIADLRLFSQMAGFLSINNGGVAYINASGLLTTSTAFTYDGETLTVDDVETETLTLSGGTANGVAYLNGSKVLTTGSALGFDGTYLTANGLRIAGADTTNTIYQATGALGISTGSAAGILLSTNGVVRQSISAIGETVWAVSGTEVARLSSSTFGIFTVGTEGPVVGIGTNYGTLGAWGSAGGGIKIARGTGAPTDLGYLYADSSGMFLQTAGAVPLVFGYNGAEVARVTAAGLGISGNLSLSASSTFPTTGMFLRSADNQLKIIGGSAGIAFAAASGASTFGMFDASGNFGIGVTPVAWFTGNSFRALQLTNSASVHGQLAGGTFLTGISSNWYANTPGADTYLANGAATQYRQWNGAHSWLIAPSGTAGAAITFTQAMALSPTGLLITGSVGTGTHPLKLTSTGCDLLRFEMNTAGSGSYIQSTNAAESAYEPLGFYAESYAFNVGKISIGGAALTDQLNVLGAARFGDGTNYAGISADATGTLIESAAGAHTVRINTAGAQAAIWDASGNLIQKLSASAPTLAANSTMTFELTDNTTLSFVVKGTDGTVRSGTLALAA